MEENCFGKLVKSLAGHDKNNIYVVIKEDEEYVYLVDGSRRPFMKPKKKKKKHVQSINIRMDELMAKKEACTLEDAYIKKVIKEYAVRKK